MAGYLAAPPPRPQLGWEGQELLTIPKAGLTIVPGAGVRGRTVGGRLLLDASRDSIAEVVSLAAPGAVTARTLGLWRNRRPAAASTLAVIDASFSVAPTAGDVSNYFRVTATDAIGTSVVLPLSTAGQRHYQLDRGAGAELVKPWTGALGGSPASVGHVHEFTPTQGMTVSAVSWTGSAARTIPGFGIYYDVALRVRARLLTADYQPIAGADGYAQIGTGADQLRHVVYFTDAAALTAGTTYRVAFDCFDDATGLPFNGTFSEFTHLLPTAQPSGSAPAGGLPVTLGAVTVAHIQAHNGTMLTAGIRALNWPDFPHYVSGAKPAPAGLIQSQSNSQGMWSLLGAPSGVAPVRGDLLFTLDAVGVPPAGAAGTDLNIRAVLLP